MARGKYKLKRIRAAERRSQVEIELGKHGKAGEMLAAATLAKPAEALGVLRRIFHLARGSGLAPAERTALLSDLEQRIRQCGTELPAKYFGVKDARELAEVFLLELEAMNIRPKTFREFIAQMRIEGYQSRVRGKLFHLFVKNFEPLQRDFKRAAAAQAKELNNPELAGKVPVGAKPPKLLNAKGVEIAQPVGFGTPRKATQIRILKTDGTSVEFIDDVYTSYSGKGADRLWSFLIEVEIKTAAAAGGFGEQIGFAQLRMMGGEVKEIEMVVEGFKEPVKVTADNLIFSPRSIDRNAVTLLSESQWGRLPKDEQIELPEALSRGDKDRVYDASRFRFQSTAKGQGETFLRITLALSTKELNKIVEAIIPFAH